ncbi:MAG: hypothetical protein WA191_07045 [Telluria sp.]|jgi:hypothetical protein
MNEVRHNICKTPMNDEEDSRFRRLANALKKQRAPLIRELIDRACDEYESLIASSCQRSHVSASRINREWPRHGHFASARQFLSLPNSRSRRGGVPVPHIRV